MGKVFSWGDRFFGSGIKVRNFDLWEQETKFLPVHRIPMLFRNFSMISLLPLLFLLWLILMAGNCILSAVTPHWGKVLESFLAHISPRCLVGKILLALAFSCELEQGMLHLILFPLSFVRFKTESLKQWPLTLTKICSSQSSSQEHNTWISRSVKTGFKPSLAFPKFTCVLFTFHWPIVSMSPLNNYTRL